MKKLFAIFTLMCTLGVSSVLAQNNDVFVGGEFNENKPKTKIIKEPKTKDDAKQIYVLPDIAIYLGYRSNLVIEGNMRFVSGTRAITSHYFGGSISIGLWGKYSGGSISYKVCPFNGKFGRIFRFGLEVAQKSRTNLSSYLEVFYGGKVANTFGKTKAYVQNERIIGALKLEILFRIKNFNIGFGSDIGAYWLYFGKEKIYGVPRRHYDTYGKIEITFRTKKYLKFREKKDTN